MCGGGGGGKASSPKYTSIDGTQFKDPNQAADHDRTLQLASAFGYDKTAPGANYNTWAAGLAPDVAKSYNDYNNQGLTAADYRSEQRIKEQDAQAKQAEDTRKANVAQSRAAVDTQFGAFDDNYYNNIGKTVLDYYLPQLDDQRQEADKQLTFKLTRQGLLNSSAAADQRAKLQSDYDLQRAGVTNKSEDAARQAREDVGGAKSQLYSFADVASDPAAVDSRLAAETARVRANAPELTPMGKVFTDYLSPIFSQVGAGLGAEAQGYRGFNTGLFNSGKSNSSVKVQR